MKVGDLKSLQNLREAHERMPSTPRYVGCIVFGVSDVGYRDEGPVAIILTIT